MKVVVLPVESILPAEWNPNIMGEAVKARLGRSIERFGVLVPLVVRPSEMAGTRPSEGPTAFRSSRSAASLRSRA